MNFAYSVTAADKCTHSSNSTINYVNDTYLVVPSVNVYSLREEEITTFLFAQLQATRS